MIEIRRILCPTDLSDIAPRAFDHALALARFHQAEVELAYVSEPLLPRALAVGSIHERYISNVVRRVRAAAFVGFVDKLRAKKAKALCVWSSSIRRTPWKKSEADRVIFTSSAAASAAWR